MENITGCLDELTDKRDDRDYLLSSIMPGEVKIPKEFLVKNLSRVSHQIYPSCTSNAAVKGTKEQQERVVLSAGFNYRNTKKLSGLYDIGGDYIFQTLKAICKFGVCEEDYFPKPSRDVRWQDYVKTVPSDEAFKNAEKYKGKTYWSMNRGAEHFKGALVTFNTPIIFAMKWYRSYSGCKGTLPLPKDWFANHCVAAVGYNEEHLIVKNSYGTNWGDGGYFYIPFKDWDKHCIYHPFVLLDLPKVNKFNSKTMFIKQENDFKVYAVIGNKKIHINTDGQTFANTFKDAIVVELSEKEMKKFEITNLTIK